MVAGRLSRQPGGRGASRPGLRGPMRPIAALGGRWVTEGAGSQTGRWVRDAAGDISRSTPPTPVPGGSAVLYGLLAGAAAPTLALGHPTPRPNGRWVAKTGRWVPRSALARRSRRLPLLSPLFPSSLSPPPAAATAAPRPEKKFGGRWVADWVLGAYPGSHPTGAGWALGRPSGRRGALGGRWVSL